MSAGDHQPGVEFCNIRYPDGTGHTNEAHSVFEAAAKALHWAEIDCRDFGTARKYTDSSVMVVSVGRMSERRFRVRIGRVREWERLRGSG